MDPAMQEKIGLTLFGFVFVVVGLGVGYLMYTQPEGLNPEWPLWLGMMAPAVFAFGGLFLMARALDCPRLSMMMLRILLLGFFGIFNWAAFFTTHMQCTDSVSFLGIELVRTIPSEEACRNGMRLIVGSIDLIIFLGLVAYAKKRWQQSRSEPPGTQ
jgi:hypothetical protein